MAGAPHRTANGSVNGHARLDGAPPQGREDPRADGDVGQAGGRADISSILARAVKGLAAQVQRRVPPADLDERDPDYIRETLPRMWLLASLYFRGEVRGLGNIPDEGPVLLVGNHSGGNLTPDTTVFSLAFHAYFGVERRFHQLAHNLVLSMPGLGFLRKYGTVAASPENARTALRSGAAVLVYPGGDREVHRPSWQSGRIDFGDRKGYVRLALEEDVPIVPVVAIGGQETALFISQGEWLAKFLMLDKLFRLKVLPISLVAPWGLNVGDFLGHLPLPSKIVVEALPPIRPREEFNGDVDEIHAHVTRVMQDTLDALSAERRFPVIG
jgi:1-acyl-sn-glycerol-3-phosphate acyltransferase